MVMQEVGVVDTEGTTDIELVQSVWRRLEGSGIDRVEAVVTMIMKERTPADVYSSFILDLQHHLDDIRCARCNAEYTADNWREGEDTEECVEEDEEDSEDSEEG